jgi:hypothetical protein
MVRFAMIALACLCAPALLAYNELVGKEAPAFHATSCVNPPADGCLSLDDCRGSVVLIKYWGPN